MPSSLKAICGLEKHVKWADGKRPVPGISANTNDIDPPLIIMVFGFMWGQEI